VRLRLLWAIWLLSLAVCPTGLLVVELSYPDAPSSSREEHRPVHSTAAWWAGVLLDAHFCLSVAAAAAVFVIARWWPWRLIAWVGIGLWLYAVLGFALGIWMSKTGDYL
jgi:hypothetical protein